MKQIKIRLSQNVGNLSSMTSGDALPMWGAPLNPVQKLDSAKTLILMTDRLVERLAQNQDVLSELHLVKKCLSSPVAHEKRPEIFRRLNLILGAFFARSESDASIFRICFEIMSLIKEQIDSHPQTDHEYAEEEWIEFEKSVYLLSDWEDQVLHTEKPVWLS